MFQKLFPHGANRTRVAANTLAQIIGKVIGAGTTFLVSLIIARQFGANGYGDFVKVTTYVAFFFLLADFGINAIYLQHQSVGEGREKDTHSLWGALLGLRLLGSFLLIFLALAILSFLPQGTTQGYTPLVRLGIILFAPAILFQAMITTSNAVFQRELRYEFATIAVAGGSMVTLITLWLLVKGGFSTAVISGTLSLLVGSGVTALVAFGLVRTRETLTITFSPRLSRQLLLPALPLGLTLLFNLVYGHGDSVLLTLTRQTAEVGIYGLAYRVFEVPLVIPTFFMNAVYPLLLRAKANSQQLTSNNQQFHKILKQSLIFLLIASFLSLIAVWIGAPWLSLIKEDFAASIPALRVLSLGLPFFFVSALTMWALIALGRQWFLMSIYGAGMLVNIALNVWLIPLYGYMAAAWVTVISEVLVLIISGFYLIRLIGYDKLYTEQTRKRNSV